MKNISKTDKKILNEFEINYLVLLLNASISKLNSNSEIVSDEYSNLIEVLKAFDYVDKNLEKQEKNIDKNYIKKPKLTFKIKTTDMITSSILLQIK